MVRPSWGRLKLGLGAIKQVPLGPPPQPLLHLSQLFMRKQGNVDENCDIKLINQIKGDLLRVASINILHLSQTFIAVIKTANEKTYLRTYPAAIMFYRNKELLHEEAIISGCLFEEMGCPIYFAMTLTRSMIISPLPTLMTSLSVPSMSFLK